ncbi:MAG: TonB family protein [Sulfuricurvum sp.]|uniref:energy transducer TonB n=1 Tax=Sulfuricurvum sp. TaxID=2025608 RepID=UPI003D116CDB
MVFLNPIVISKKIHNDFLLKIKSFAASLFVHAALLGSTLYFALNDPIPLPLEEKPVLLSLADYAPSTSVTSEKIPMKSHSKSIVKSLSSKPEKTVLKPKKTLQTIPSLTPAVSSEASTPQTVSMRPSVVPSDLKPVSGEPLHSTRNPVTDDSPHDVPTTHPTNESTKQNVSSDEINGATLGRIRLMIENALTYPAVARKLHLEGVVIVSFILKPSGIVEKAEILSTSGSSTLDNKAIQTVLSLSGDYPTLTKTVYLKIPIAFSLNKS